MNFLTLFMASILILAINGCGDDDAESGGGVPESESAVLYTVNTLQPDGNALFMGIYPEFPRSQPDFSQMVELGPQALTFHFEDNVYSMSWSSLSLTRWTVGNNLEPERGNTVSFSNNGLPPFSPMAFHSATRGFAFDLGNGKIIEFNPTEMIITEEITAEKAPFPYSSLNVSPRHFGNKILLNVSNIDYDNSAKMENNATVLVFDVDTKTVEYITDDRIPTVYSNILDSQGYVYMTATRDEHYTLLFGDNEGLENYGKMIRFDMRINAFDPDFEVDLNQVIPGEIVGHFYYLNDNEMIIETSPAEMPENVTADNYFATAPAKLKKLNLTTLEVTEYPEVGENTQSWINILDFHDDGKAIYPAAEFPNNDYNAVNTRFYEVTSTGAKLLYTTTNSWLVDAAVLR